MSQQRRELTGGGEHGTGPTGRPPSRLKRVSAPSNGSAIAPAMRSSSASSVSWGKSKVLGVESEQQAKTSKQLRETETSSSCHCLATGFCMRVWVAVVCLAVLYNLWLIVARTAFHKLQASVQTVWFVLDYTADTVFITDIAIRFRTTSAWHPRYLLSWHFFADIISILPLDFLYFEVGIKPILRVNRLFKCHRLLSLHQLLRTRIPAVDVWRLVVLLHNVLLIIHWNGCIYFLISDSDGSPGDYWSYPSNEIGNDSLTRQYVYSFYWSTSVLLGLGQLGCMTPETNAQ